MPVNREITILSFLQRYGWDSAKRWRLAGDASFRKYDRLEGKYGNAVLMDAPPPHENVRSFVRVAQHLYSHGFSVPKVIAEDTEAGILLLEDLGDDTYTHLLEHGHDERELYTIATDTLIALHRLPEDQAIPKGVGPYDTARLLEEVGRLLEWYMPLVNASLLPSSVIDEYNSIWKSLLPLAWKVPTSLILFDYHVDNLLLLPERSGIRSCGLLDFQDAVAGPVTYDLMSLLEDARRNVSSTLPVDMKQRYLNAFSSLVPKDFETSWAVMAAQRHTRVIGTFARLKLRDGKPHYLQHIPRLWRYMDQSLIHPSLKDLREWFGEYVPQALRVVVT